MSFGDKLLNAFFQSVTLRTAGFNTIDLGAMRESSKLWSVILMFIGASPASTGGGVKTTTMGVLFLLVLSVIRGQDDVTVMKRRLPIDLMRQALSILFISLCMLLAGTMVITIFEQDERSFLDLLFESTSAMATVGVTAIGTPALHQPSKLMLMLMMYFGRVGPLTLALALAHKQTATKNHLKYPEDKIMIG